MSAIYSSNATVLEKPSNVKRKNGHGGRRIVSRTVTEGIKFSDIKAQWRYNKDDDQKKHFNERLPESEVTRLAAGEAAMAQSVQAFEPEQQKIQGFFLEGVPS